MSDLFDALNPANASIRVFGYWLWSCKAKHQVVSETILPVLIKARCGLQDVEAAGSQTT